MKCPACGTENASENVFCLRCGVRLDEAKAAPKPISDEAQKSELTSSSKPPKPTSKRAASARMAKPEKASAPEAPQSASEVARDLAFVVSDKDDKVTRYLLIGGCAGSIISLFMPCIGMSQDAVTFFGAYFANTGVTLNSSFNLLDVSNLLNQLSRQLGSAGSGYATALTTVAGIALVGAVLGLVFAVRKKMRAAKIISWVTAAVMIVDLALVGSIPSQFEEAAKRLAQSGQESMVNLMNMMANPWSAMAPTTTASSTDVTLLIGFWLGLVAVLVIGASAIRATSLRIKERERTLAKAAKMRGRG